APNPIKIATYRMVSVNDTSLAGQIIDCMASGADPSHGVSAVSDTAGYRLSLTEIFCPLYFSSPFLGSIEGIVSDINANPIAGVAVECMGTGIVDTTNGLGEYVLPEIDPGTYNVSFTHPDYMPVIEYSVEVLAGQVTVVDVTLAEITGDCVYVTGDVNNSGAYNGLDITYGVNFFKGGAEPLYSCECTPGDIWYVAGDVNNSCSYNGLDITYGVSYFKGGPDPIPCEDCPPASVSILRKSQIEVSK
ncbi:MAG: carboxypeptidase regulatory-like domain-containing protein, partial [Candidatus Zixiibacteriota bacterium]